MWGREIHHGNSLLPQQIVTSGQALLSRPMTIVYQRSDGPQQTIKLQRTRDETHQHGYRSYGSYEDSDISVTAVAKLEFDGFQKFDIVISPKQEITISKLEAQLYFNNAPALSFSKFLEYDFSRQNVIPGSDGSTTGVIPEQIDFHFNPTIWVGSNNIGLEWIQETNIHFGLDRPQATHTLSKNSNETQLITRVIDRPTKLAKPLPYSFALIATPTKPRNHKLAGRTLTSRLPKQGESASDHIYIGHWKRTPLDLPGLPIPSSRQAEFTKYEKHRKRLRQASTPYVPYSALYILPATLDIFRKHPEWRAAPARRGSRHWTERIKKRKSIQPVSYQSQEFRQFIVDTHLETQNIHGIDGIYFDVATMREVPTTTKAMVEKLNLEPKRTNI